VKGIPDAREAEVDQTDSAPFLSEDVLWLDVQMGHPLLVQVGERPSHTRDDRCGLPGAMPRVGHRLGEALSPQEFQNEEGPVFVEVEVVYTGKVWMVQRREDPAFRQKSLAERGIILCLPVAPFDDHVLLERRVHRPEDLRLPPGAEPGDDHVLADTSGGVARDFRGWLGHGNSIRGTCRRRLEG
jgi:hypothetical protein